MSCKTTPHLLFSEFLSNPLQPHLKPSINWFRADWDDESCLILCFFHHGLMNPTWIAKKVSRFLRFSSHSFIPSLGLLRFFLPAGDYMVMATKISSLPSYPKTIVLLPSKGLRSRFLVVGCLRQASIDYDWRPYPYLCLFHVAMPSSINSSR